MCVAPNRSASVRLNAQRVDGHDLLGAGEPRALYRVDPDAADADHDDGVAGLDVRCVDRRAESGGHAAADERRLVQRDVAVDLDAAELVHHRVRLEGAEHAHEPGVLAADAVAGRCRRESWLAFQDQRAVVAEVLVAAGAGRALSARGDEAQHHVVARCQPLDAGADLDHLAGALVAADVGEAGHRQVAGQQMLVGMAQAARREPYQHFAFARAVELDLLDRPVLADSPEHRCHVLHGENVRRGVWSAPHGRLGLSGETAINRDNGAGDPRGRRRAQECHRGRHLRRFEQPPEIGVLGEFAGAGQVVDLGGGRQDRGVGRPGLTTFAVTEVPRRSAASVRTSPTTPCLAAT